MTNESERLEKSFPFLAIASLGIALVPVVDMVCKTALNATWAAGCGLASFYYFSKYENNSLANALFKGVSSMYFVAPSVTTGLLSLAPVVSSSILPLVGTFISSMTVTTFSPLGAGAMVAYLSPTIWLIGAGAVVAYYSYLEGNSIIKASLKGIYTTCTICPATSIGFAVKAISSVPTPVKIGVTGAVVTGIYSSFFKNKTEETNKSNPSETQLLNSGVS